MPVHRPDAGAHIRNDAAVSPEVPVQVDQPLALVAFGASIRVRSIVEQTRSGWIAIATGPECILRESQQVFIIELVAQPERVPGELNLPFGGEVVSELDSSRPAVARCDPALAHEGGHERPDAAGIDSRGARVGVQTVMAEALTQVASTGHVLGTAGG